MEIINAHETGHYDPRTCRNGGGYWNFKGSLKVKNLTIAVEDESCSDFGSRIFFAVSNGEATANIIYCTMESDCISEQCNEYGWCGLDELDNVIGAEYIDVRVLWSAHNLISEAARYRKMEEEWEEDR